MATFECYACQGTVREGTRACPGCGAEQTKSAREIFRAQRQVRTTAERWRIASATIAILSFALGAGFGMWSARGSATPPADHAAAAAVHMSVEQINDAFLRSLNETVSLGLASWIWAEDGTLVLELFPPTAQRPMVLWQTLDPSEREQMMGFVGVAYTRSLIAGGTPVDLSVDGHPPLLLKYRDLPAPLAVRLRDGAVRVYTSPFDRPTPQ